VSGLENVVSMEAVSDGKVLWSDNLRNQTQWKVSRTADTALNANGSLILTASFSGLTKAASVTISRAVNLNLDESPVVRTILNVSRGVSYGVRFSGINPDNSTFPAWKEGSRFQHRPGLGVREFLEVNLVTETFLATQKVPPSGSRITQVLFYIEAVSGTSGQFSMTISTLSARSLQTVKLDSTETSGSFRGVIMKLGQIPTDLPLFQVFVSYDIKGTTDLRYTPYFIQNMLVKAQGFTYVPKNITTYELAVLTPVRVAQSSPFSIDPASSSIIISAGVGQITFFKPNSLSLRFTSQPNVLQTQTQPNISDSLVIYYLLFLFATPVGMVVLLNRGLKPED